MLLLRSSIYGFGSYYGDEFNSSTSLTQSQMEVNAKCIYGYFHGLGWTVNAISAILGNMEAESTINPGRWQGNRVGGDPEGHGYSLVQWTPYTKYTEWVRSTYGQSSDPSLIDYALDRIDYEVNTGLQWITTNAYGLSFKEFTKSNLPPSELAKAFLLNYERPADQSSSVQNYRGSLADKWYKFLTGVTPPTPTPGGDVTRKKKGFNFVLFGRHRSFRY